MKDACGTKPADECTYEGIVEHILHFLWELGLLTSERTAIPWDSFLHLSDLVHETFEVPCTSITPIMRRLLFGLSVAATPSNIVGVGTYVGYAFSWLLRDRADPETGPHFEFAEGIDSDPVATAVACRNCSVLGHRDRLVFEAMDGVSVLREFKRPIDLLYLDLDDPTSGKAAYRTVLEIAGAHLGPGALVLAHDACVPKFESDIKQYHEYVTYSGRFAGPWILPVDSCGLSVAVAL